MATPNIMQTFRQLQASTIAARIRTGDKCIGTQVNRGRFDVVRAVPPAKRGAYVVTVLAADLSPSAAVAYLDAMQ